MPRERVAQGTNSSPGARQIRLAIVSSVRLYRDGLREALARQPVLEVVGAARGLPDGCELVTRSRPDITLVDLVSPPGLEIVRVLAAARLTRVVALAAPEADEELLQCAEAGLAGYVTREASLDELVRMIELAHRGQAVCSPRMAALLLERVAALSAGTKGGRPADNLTPRERQIVALISDGLSNKEIGGRLCIELGTVKNHVHNILEKLEVSKRTEAVARARSVLFEADLPRAGG
jgi:two-component system, NarL family, nitrate/nitrite response regulator NarL